MVQEQKSDKEAWYRIRFFYRGLAHEKILVQKPGAEGKSYRVALYRNRVLYRGLVQVFSTVSITSFPSHVREIM